MGGASCARCTGAAEVPLLFKINMAAGHGGASGRYDSLREIAFDYAWVLAVLGLGPASAASRSGGTDS